MEIDTNGVELGDRVKCTITNFEGVVVGVTKYFNGCVQCTIAPKYDGKTFGSMEEGSIDIQSLKIIKKAPVKTPVEEDFGGATKRGVRMRGY